MELILFNQPTNQPSCNLGFRLGFGLAFGEFLHMAYHRIIIDSERSLGTGVRVLMRREGVNYEVLQWSFQLWFGGHSDYTLCFGGHSNYPFSGHSDYTLCFGGHSDYASVVIPTIHAMLRWSFRLWFSVVIPTTLCASVVIPTMIRWSFRLHSWRDWNFSTSHGNWPMMNDRWIKHFQYQLLTEAHRTRASPPYDLSAGIRSKIVH